MFVFFPRLFPSYICAKELHCSVVPSPLGRASMSASYNIFFCSATDHDNLHNGDPNTISIISSRTIWFQPPKIGGYALLVVQREEIPSPPHNTWFCGCWAMFYEGRICLKIQQSSWWRCMTMRLDNKKEQKQVDNNNDKEKIMTAR